MGKTQAVKLSGLFLEMFIDGGCANSAEQAVASWCSKSGTAPLWTNVQIRNIFGTTFLFVCTLSVSINGPKIGQTSVLRFQTNFANFHHFQILSARYLQKFAWVCRSASLRWSWRPFNRYTSPILHRGLPVCSFSCVARVVHRANFFERNAVSAHVWLLRNVAWNAHRA